MKIGRNNPCPCGSGKKFKKCHNNPRFELPFLIQQAHIEKHLEEEGKRLLEQKRRKKSSDNTSKALGGQSFQLSFRVIDLLQSGARCTMASGRPSMIF